MAAYVLYNQSTGAVAGVFSVLHSADDAALVAANTPSGMSALEIDPTSSVVVDQKGWSVIDGALTLTPPTTAELLAAAKATRLGVLATSYEAAKASGVSYMSTVFMTDDNSQQTFAHALLAFQAAGAVPDGFFAVDASYNKVPMNLSQLQGLIEAIAAQVWTIFQRWITVREELAVAATVDAVNAISW